MSANLSSARIWWSVPVLAAVILVGGYTYMQAAFPPVRCQGAVHSQLTEQQNDCFACHQKTTPKLAQDWYESKHGVNLVKCFVCHGQPDGKGSIRFSATPAVDEVCIRCHDPAIKRMRAKFGERRDCAECHPYHSNSLHHEAYQRTESKKTIE